MNKRAQASLEYLMTYGWVLILIATIIGVLVFVITPPESEVSFQSSDPSKFLLKGGTLQDSVATAILQNATGGELEVTDVSVSGVGYASGCTVNKSVTPVISAGKTMLLECQLTGSDPNGTVTIAYKDFAGLDKEVQILIGGGSSTIASLCDNGELDPGETCDTPGSEVGMGLSVLCNSTCSGYDVTGCATLSQPGNYKLTQNIGSTLNCLTISNNVGGNRTIDCQSRIISDPAATKIYRGINMVNAQDVTIQNCKVTGYATGIYVQNSSNITLSGNNGYNNRYGSAFFGSGITLNNCTACNNNNNDIYCSGSTITGTGNIATNPSALCPDIFSDCPP